MHRVIDSYVHNGHIGVMVEFEVRTDFTARLDEFQTLTKDLAIQVAAMDPGSVEELLAQLSAKEPDKTIGETIADTSASLGERIRVLRFVRWQTGTGPSPTTPPPPDPAKAVSLKVVK